MSQAVAENTKIQYLKDAESLISGSGPDWLAELRESGLDIFREMPLPNSKIEEWRQTNIASLNNQAFETSLLPVNHKLTKANLDSIYYNAEGWPQLVYVDGFYDDSLSKTKGLEEGVIAGSLAESILGEEAQTIAVQLGGKVKSHNAYTALNAAFVQDGAFVHVPSGVKQKTPIHLIFLTSNERGDKAANIRNLFVLEESAEAELIITFVSESGNTNSYFNNVVQQVHLAPNSGLSLYKLVDEGISGNHLDTLEMTQSRDSRLKTFNATFGGAIVRNQICNEIIGAGADCDLSGLYLNDGNRLIDNALNITHHAPSCQSRIGYKGILEDKSKAVFLGKVYVHPEAQGTDSDQLSNNLLLSDGATIDSKPQLEIYADEVKCTHGTTIGSPPEELVFYFRSRGIDKAVALGMLTYGFADEIVDELGNEAVKERLAQLIYNRYSPKEAG